mmetsp:Transcript_50485/g.113657  ORF Transcript_50485/g.113657 Transcript_50485/m.113657 type:complete len:111 (-) Transcript_50485:94-426(-)
MVDCLLVFTVALMLVQYIRIMWTQQPLMGYLRAVMVFWGGPQEYVVSRLHKRDHCERHLYALLSSVCVSTLTVQQVGVIYRTLAALKSAVWPHHGSTSLQDSDRMAHSTR